MWVEGFGETIVVSEKLWAMRIEKNRAKIESRQARRWERGNIFDAEVENLVGEHACPWYAASLERGLL